MIDVTFSFPGRGEFNPLIRPEWESRCRLRIYGAPEHPVVILSELEGDSGTSVTNAAENIATRVVAYYELDPASTVWIEHYGPWRHGGETYDLITFEWEGRQARSPMWQPTSREEVARLIGTTP